MFVVGEGYASDAEGMTAGEEEERTILAAVLALTFARGAFGLHDGCYYIIYEAL
jgi:hypothetical protein